MLKKECALFLQKIREKSPQFQRVNWRYEQLFHDARNQGITPSATQDIVGHKEVGSLYIEKMKLSIELGALRCEHGDCFTLLGALISLGFSLTSLLLQLDFLEQER